MDATTTLQLLGSLGEFLGALAVLATLGYLVVQTNQNTKMLRSTSYNSWVDSRRGALNMLADHAQDYAKIYTQPNRSLQDLDPAERLLHAALFTHRMNYHEQTYLNYLDGTVDAQILAHMDRQVIFLFGMNRLNQESWDSLKSRIYDPRFVAYVEQNIRPKFDSETAKQARP